MDPQDVASVFAVTLVLAATAVIAGAIIPKGRTLVARGAPVIVAAMAVGATLGSLYFSEVADFVPCTYCWWQRVAMYPIAVITSLALAFRDRWILRYSLALGSIGLAISIYHIQLQIFPDQSSNSCDLTSPCTAKWVEALGFMTIPQMAGISFAIVVITSVVGLRCNTAGTSTSSTTETSP